jgi:branched-chain amino acid transport system substrate-binding protein
MLVALLAAGPAGAAPATGEPFEINALLSMTGPAAFAGKQISQSLGILEKVVNEKGGIKGRPVKFVISDTQSNPQVALQLANTLIPKKIAIFLGPDIVSQCNAIAPVLMRTGPVEYCYSPGVTPPNGSYFFSGMAPTRDDAVALIRYFRLRGWKRVGLITSTDATGQSIEQSIDRALGFPENKEMSLVARSHFNITDLSVSAQIIDIKSKSPQVLIAWSTGTPFGTLLRGIHDAGLEIPIAGGNGNMIFSQLEQYADFMPKELYFPGRRPNAPGTPPGPIKDAQTVYFNAFKAAGARPDFVNSIAWDPAMIAIDAFRKLGTNATAEQMHEYLEQLHSWTGINGVYDFRDGEQRGIGLNSIVVVRWNPAGREFVAVSRAGGFLK